MCSRTAEFQLQLTNPTSVGVVLSSFIIPSSYWLSTAWKTLRRIAARLAALIILLAGKGVCGNSYSSLATPPTWCKLDYFRRRKHLFSNHLKYNTHNIKKIIHAFLSEMGTIGGSYCLAFLEPGRLFGPVATGQTTKQIRLRGHPERAHCPCKGEESDRQRIRKHTIHVTHHR